MSTVVVSDLPDPLVGRILDGKYRILEPLGEGGMAQVYTAEHLVLEHLVAIKFLRRELAIEAEISERFAREAKTIAQLNSEHIVKVLDVGYLEGVGPFMVMEHLDGEDLQTRLGRNGPFPLREALGFVMQAADGLDQAHQKGIVHRDLKPENLFLARSQRGVETIKLLDFGISKQTGTTLSRLTQPQVAIGSPNYMAPEQLMGSEAIDARADVWSLGVVLYRLATGALPFTGQSIAEVYSRILHTEPHKPSDVCPGLPRAFDDLVLRCLKKSASERPPNVRALCVALRDIMGYGSRAPSVGAPTVVERSRSVEPVSVTTRFTLEAFSVGWRWRAAAAMVGVVLASLATLMFASNALPVRAEPLPTLAGRSIDEPNMAPNLAERPDLVQVADLPLESARRARGAPGAALGAPALKPAELVQHGSARPTAAPARATSVFRDSGRGPAAPQPPRPNRGAVSDFGGRR